MSSTSSLPPSPASNPPAFIYKIVPESEWKATYEKDGIYRGSELDKKDGFMHASTLDSLARTLELYFSNEKGVILVQIKLDDLQKNGEVRWDWVESRQTYFPHYMNMEFGVRQQHIQNMAKLQWDEDNKKHVLPEWVQ